MTKDLQSRPNQKYFDFGEQLFGTYPGGDILRFRKVTKNIQNFQKESKFSKKFKIFKKKSKFSQIIEIKKNEIFKNNQNFQKKNEIFIKNQNLKKNEIFKKTKLSSSNKKHNNFLLDGIPCNILKQIYLLTETRLRTDFCTKFELHFKA